MKMYLKILLVTIFGVGSIYLLGGLPDAIGLLIGIIIIVLFFEIKYRLWD